MFFTASSAWDIFILFHFIIFYFISFHFISFFYQFILLLCFFLTSSSIMSWQPSIQRQMRSCSGTEMKRNPSSLKEICKFTNVIFWNFQVLVRSSKVCDYSHSSILISFVHILFSDCDYVIHTATTHSVPQDEVMMRNILHCCQHSALLKKHILSSRFICSHLSCFHSIVFDVFVMIITSTLAPRSSVEKLEQTGHRESLMSRLAAEEIAKSFISDQEPKSIILLSLPLSPLLSALSPLPLSLLPSPPSPPFTSLIIKLQSLIWW